MHKVPNLYRNRLGTYYLRITVLGREVKRSLGTKDRPKAVRSALLFALAKTEGLHLDTNGVGVRLSQPTIRPTASKPQGDEGMKYSSKVLHKGKGASDLPNLGEDTPSDIRPPNDPSVPFVNVPEGIKKLDMVMAPDGTVSFNNIKSDEDVVRAQLLAKAIKAGDFQTAIGLAAPVEGEPLHLRPIAAMSDISQASKMANASKPFKKVQVLYLAEMKFQNGQKMIDDKESTYADFLGIVGSIQIDEISGPKAQIYKQDLLTRGITAIRMNAKLGHLSELCEWAARNHHMTVANPFKTMKVSRKGDIKKNQENYEQFTNSELETVFKSPLYVPFLCESDYYWLPWMALHTGARLEELASLDLVNIKEDQGIHYFDIRKGKNSNSIRRVPIHSNLINAGFLDFVAKQRAKGESLLFSHLVCGKNGYSKNMSRRFGQYLDKLGIKEGTKVFHSFRGTFITKMTEKNVHPGMLMALVGHYEQAKVDLSAPHFQNYQGSKLLAALKDTVELFEVGPIKLQPQPPAFRSELKPKKRVSVDADKLKTKRKKDLYT